MMEMTSDDQACGDKEKEIKIQPHLFIIISIYVFVLSHVLCHVAVR